MNAGHSEQNRRASDMTPVDIAAIATFLVAMVIAGIAAAQVDWKLMLVADVIALPAGVAKVWSTRVKARREAHPSNRDRRVGDPVRTNAAPGAAVAS